MIRLAAALILICEAAIAAQIINLKSLSPDGKQAILTYEKLWVEVDLSLEGGALPLPAPEGCDWTSMAYAPVSADLAMTAFCPGPVRDCASGVSRLLLREEGGLMREVLTADGVRLSNASWDARERRMILIHTGIKPPEVSRLGDLNRSAPRCGWRQASFQMVDIERGLPIRFDILPAGWRAREVIALSDAALIAVVAARRGAEDGSPAAAAINTACAGKSNAFHGLAAVCTARGYDLLLSWTDGEWRLGMGAAATDRPLRSRVIATPSLNTIAKERCKTSQTAELVGLACTLSVSRGGETVELAAPGGLFGDLALSGDGRMLAAVYAGRSARGRRFDLWDLETGEYTSLAPLLDPVRHFGVWPPVE